MMRTYVPYIRGYRKRFRILRHIIFKTISLNRLVELWESGLPPLWVKNHIPRALQCFAKIKPRTRQVAIRLIDLLGAFSIFSLGISLAAIAFVSELLVQCAFKLRYMANTVKILVTPAHEHG